MIDRVTEYATRVVNGEVEGVGNYHKLACARHLKDLARERTEDFPYYWDAKASDKILRFAETLIIKEGKQQKRVKLIPSQVFDLGCTFGWKKVRDNNRRFRRRYKSVARQNGKTFENGIMGTYIAGFSGYHEGLLFTAATKKDQAKLAWKEMTKFITADEDLSEMFKIVDYNSEIRALRTNCVIKALSREGGLDDGFRSIFASIDEIHQHKDNSVYKAIYNGTRALDETLVSMITTRGKNLNSFCYEMDTYCEQILEGVVIAEDFFVDIYCLDKDDDPFDETKWIKANPFLCTTKQGMDTLRADADTARQMQGAELKDFLTKGLNQWVQGGDNAFVNTDKFLACGTDRTLEDMRGRECYIGLDLSSGGDLTTYNLEFPLEDGRFFEHSHSFMPRGRLEEHIQTDLAPYDMWEQQGLITVTGGQGDFKNDYKFIIKELKELQEKYDLTYMAIGYDGYNADGILADLEEFDCPLLQINQTAKFLNAATDDIRLNVEGGLFEYNKNNQLFAYSFANAELTYNSMGEMKVDKHAHGRTKRIDPVDACVDAHTAYMKRPQELLDFDAMMDEYLQNV